MQAAVLYSEKRARHPRVYRAYLARHDTPTTNIEPTDIRTIGLEYDALPIQAHHHRRFEAIVFANGFVVTRDMMHSYGFPVH